MSKPRICPPTIKPRRIGDAPDMKMAPTTPWAGGGRPHTAELTRGLMADLAYAITAKVAQIHDPEVAASVKAIVDGTLLHHLDTRLGPGAAASLPVADVAVNVEAELAAPEPQV